MNKISRLFLPLCLMFTLISLHGCDQTDDVLGIFTGQAWKLTDIFDSHNDQQSNYWTSQEEKDISYQLKAQAGTFTITFSGIGDLDVVSGTFSARGVTSTFAGNWTANGDSRDFNTSNVESVNDTDVLANAFIRAIRSGHSYEGDYDNLYIYFRDGQVEKYMLFHRVR